jgi:hypothetical protein
MDTAATTTTTTTTTIVITFFVEIKEVTTILTVYDINMRKGHNYPWKRFSLEFKP